MVNDVDGVMGVVHHRPRNENTNPCICRVSCLWPTAATLSGP